MRATWAIVLSAVLSACTAEGRGHHVRLDHRYDEAVSAAVERAKAIYRVPAALVPAVIRQESVFRPRAVSRARARGLMQVMPANARRLGFTADELWDPAKNILAGVRSLAVLLRQYRGDVVSALVAYNARPRSLVAPLPRNGETPAYVLKVLAFCERYRCEETCDCSRLADLVSQHRPASPRSSPEPQPRRNVCPR
jgi:soluble lytic murein transglycosylase-like protein